MRLATKTFKLPIAGPRVPLVPTVRINCMIEDRCDHCRARREMNRTSPIHYLLLFLLGAYVASGSSSNGIIFVWDCQGKLVQKLGGGHEVGVCGFAWGFGGESGQQVASVDKSGRLVLWA